MVALVGYSSSSEDEEPSTPPAKKRRVSGHSDMPPLPAAFLDQYSSTVRTSVQDDPALHGGRKRVTPHVQGNWPAHVYLEWHPNATEASVLGDVVSASQHTRDQSDEAKRTSAHDDHSNEVRTVHSLLENELGVSLPLHISLSRPLTLKTDQKDAFLERLETTIGETSIKSFLIQPKDLAWHSNENSTRWFLVLRLQRSTEQEMTHLLAACNDVANDFEQPLLYASKDKRGKVQSASEVVEKFHISVAWSLEGPDGSEGKGSKSSLSAVGQGVGGIPRELLDRLSDLNIGFGEVKVRIGQDVHNLPLKAARRKT